MEDHICKIDDDTVVSIPAKASLFKVHLSEFVTVPSDTPDTSPFSNLDDDHLLYDEFDRIMEQNNLHTEEEHMLVEVLEHVERSIDVSPLDSLCSFTDNVEDQVLVPATPAPIVPYTQSQIYINYNSPKCIPETQMELSYSQLSSVTSSPPQPSTVQSTQLSTPPSTYLYRKATDSLTEYLCHFNIPRNITLPSFSSAELNDFSSTADDIMYPDLLNNFNTWKLIEIDAPTAPLSKRCRGCKSDTNIQPLCKQCMEYMHRLNPVNHTLLYF